MVNLLTRRLTNFHSEDTVGHRRLFVFLAIKLFSSGLPKEIFTLIYTKSGRVPARR